MSECLKCGTEIGNASYCGCGWKRPKATDLKVERRCSCCYEGCQNDASVKVKAPTGWANMCQDHLRIWHHAKAEKYCKDIGLDTREKRADWVNEFRKSKGLPVMREPGQDDEERGLDALVPAEADQA